jgi:CheY-like chemotaxis protein
MTRTLLFVLEDDERQIAAIRHVTKIEFPDADLRLAEDGQAAIDILMKERVLPDLAILDINTPRMNGLEVLERIRSVKQFNYLPIIMFTTSDSDIDRQRALELGANAYVVKPPIRMMGSELRKIVDSYGKDAGEKPGADSTWQEINIAEAMAESGGSAWDDIDSLLGEL